MAKIAWTPWVKDPVAEKTGITFDRTPAGEIVAPTGMLRVCAYHIDWDERPVVYVDVKTMKEAEHICDNLGKLSGRWNVDYGVIYDDRGECLRGPPW